VNGAVETSAAIPVVRWPERLRDFRLLSRSEPYPAVGSPWACFTCFLRNPFYCVLHVLDSTERAYPITERVRFLAHLFNLTI